MKRTGGPASSRRPAFSAVFRGSTILFSPPEYPNAAARGTRRVWFDTSNPVR
ncbi:MAG TPA: hypothetical protein VF766_11605 [Pyrinomonadaceae bacterium]